MARIQVMADEEYALRMSEKHPASSTFCLGSMRGKTKIRKKGQKYAGFRVLKAPDVPSVLLELGYMSNPVDVKRLMSAAWRKKVASAVANAVDTYFSKRTARNPY